MPPESHAVMPGIVATAFVGKIDRHLG
jgi:hypothetical protein